jgi:AAA domain-containing protein
MSFEPPRVRDADDYAKRFIDDIERGEGLPADYDDSGFEAEQESRNGQRPLRLFTDVEIETLPDPVWAIDRLYTLNSVVMLYGPRGVGKTFAALGWAFSHATGKPWLGKEVRRGPVAYIMAEGRGGLGVRVRAQKEHLGITGLAGVHFITQAVPMLNAAEVNRLIAALQTLPEKPVAVVWDTLSRCFVGGDENGSKDMAEFVAHVDRVREATGATANVLHHSGHSSTERERGSSVLGAAADTIIAMRSADGALTLECDKQKDGTSFDPIPVRLLAVGGSCVLSHYQNDVIVGGVTITGIQRQALKVLSTAFLKDGASTTAWLKACELTEASFYRARTALVNNGLVTQIPNGRNWRYAVSDRGSQTLNYQAIT